jgi:hypothetical protein
MANKRRDREQGMNLWDFHFIPVASDKVLSSLEVDVRHSRIVTLEGIQMILKVLACHGNCNLIRIFRKIFYSIASSSG